MQAIDKLRAITNWSNYQNENFNSTFSSIEKIEKAYDFAKENNFEFLDSQSRANYEDEENDKIDKFLTNLYKSK